MRLQAILLLCVLGFIASAVGRDVQQRHQNKFRLKEIIQAIKDSEVSDEVTDLQVKDEVTDLEVKDDVTDLQVKDDVTDLEVYEEVTDLELYDDAKSLERREVELERRRRFLVDTFKKAVNKIVDVTKKVVDKTKDAFKKAKDKAKKALKKVKKAFKVVKGFVVKGYKFTKDKFKKAFNKAKDAFKKLGDLVKGIDFDAVVNELIELIDSEMTRAACITLCQASVAAIFGSFTVFTAGITSALAFLATSACPPVCEGALALLEDLVDTAYNSEPEKA